MLRATQISVRWQSVLAPMLFLTATSCELLVLARLWSATARAILLAICFVWDIGRVQVSVDARSIIVRLLTWARTLWQSIVLSRCWSGRTPSCRLGYMALCETRFELFWLQVWRWDRVELLVQTMVLSYSLILSGTFFDGDNFDFWSFTDVIFTLEIIQRRVKPSCFNSIKDLRFC